MPSEQAPKSDDIEAKIVRDAYIEADPTTYSELGHGSLSKISRHPETAEERYVDDKGDIWYQIGSYPETQQFMSGLLKGIMNVSDVTRFNGVHFSKEMPLEKVNSEASLDEVQADAALLRLVFGDGDRSWGRYLEMRLAAGKVAPHNLRYEKGRVAYYDTEGAANMFHTTPSRNNDVEDLPGTEVTGLKSLRKGALEILSNKLTSLKERIRGEDGKELLTMLGKRAGRALLSSKGVRGIFPISTSERKQSQDEAPYLQERIVANIEETQKLIDDEVASRGATI